MTRPLHIWIIFAVCLGVLLAAMGWVSVMALRLDRVETQARQAAAFEENVRLALWRMDSALAPLIFQESSWPYFFYRAFYRTNEAYYLNRNTNRVSDNSSNPYLRMSEELRPYLLMDEELSVRMFPSPLLVRMPTNVLLHFEFPPDGPLTSPQAPSDPNLLWAASRRSSSQKIQHASQRLAELQKLVTRDSLLRVLAVSGTNTTPAYLAGNLNAELLTPGNRSQMPVSQQAEQNYRNTVELQQRAQSQQQLAIANQQASANFLYPQPANVREGALTPLWIDSALLLVRRVTLDNAEYLQGAWLDWPNIQRGLLESIRDLLPSAQLEPIKPNSMDEQARVLASLPVKLVPGPMPTGVSATLSPIRLALCVAWGCMLLAIAAVMMLLRGVLSLSERRGAFVSAVTHELRTPLTTFRMYTEMLADGIVSDEQKRASYLSTLRREAERLGHLVENVLAYARLERGSARSRLETVTLQHLVDRVKGRLAERAEQAGMNLVVNAAEPELKTTVRVDTVAVEQILFNLVDNACKYAASATNRVVSLETVSDGRFALLRIRDFGAGISKDGARRLFRPFSKSAHEAAHTAPGVGLGLALCRRLSRTMGGDLKLDAKVKDGACFVLSLPKSA
jgi:signal transduction histidine kinase